MNVRRRGAARPHRALFPALALAGVLGLGAAEVRADLTPPPPPQCTGGHRGDVCEGAGLEPGVCTAVACDDKSRFWRLAKGADECLACVVPPDPAVNDGPAGGTPSASAPAPAPATPPSDPQLAPVTPSGFAARAAAIGAGVLALAGGVALLRRRRKEKP